MHHAHQVIHPAPDAHGWSAWILNGRYRIQDGQWGDLGQPLILEEYYSPWICIPNGQSLTYLYMSCAWVCGTPSVLDMLPSIVFTSFPSFQVSLALELAILLPWFLKSNDVAIKPTFLSFWGLPFHFLIALSATLVFHSLAWRRGCNNHKQDIEVNWGESSSNP